MNRVTDPVAVSIVTPTRNRPLILARALDSIRRQTFSDFEVIVVDDGSDPEHADAYRELTSRYDSRFRLLQPLRPGQLGSGPALSRNRGIFNGRGPFVAFLDDDDEWTWDGYLEHGVRVLEETGLELHCCDMRAFRGNELVYDSWFVDLDSVRKEPIVARDPATYRISRRSFVDAARHRVIHPNMLLLRRTLIERTGGFLPSLRFAEDTEFVLRLADSIDAALLCTERVARYRLPEGNSHSLSMNALEQELQTLAAAQQLVNRAKTAEVIDAARRLESWTLRALSRHHRTNGARKRAIGLALQALVVRPGMGSARDLLRAVWN